jgi:hypothetical protein
MRASPQILGFLLRRIEVLARLVKLILAVLGDACSVIRKAFWR